MTIHNKHWLLPEGIDELLPEQARVLEKLRRRLLDTYASWGYELVITPFIEYLESLLTGTGKDLELQTFKMTDQMSGRLLGIRADITPQAARIDAHQLRQDLPTRLCYIGSVFRTRPDGFSASRSPLQIGAELYGHSGVESDVEILCLMLTTLELAGVKNVSLDLGHVGIFKGLAQQAGIDNNQEAALFAALQRKAIPEIEGLVASFGIKDDHADMLVSLARLNGDSEVIEQAREVLAAADQEVLEALDYVEQVASVLGDYMPDVSVHFDLAELRAYQYQTGVVFAAFIPESGNEIARGGRYDHIGEKFGRARPATGFSSDLKTLMQYGACPVIEAADRILAPCDGAAELTREINKLRISGKVVVRSLSGREGEASSMGCNQELVKRDGKWLLRQVN